MKQFFLCVCALLVLFTSLAVAQDLPKSFDIRNKYPHCTNILDQGYCGSCWSFSATQGLSDRFCIATNKSLILSPQYNINCETGDQGGCSGGSTLLAYQWFASNGVDKLSCTNYYSGETQDTGKCPTTCDDSSPITLYHAQKGYSLKASTSKETVHNIMRDVIENGPVSVSFIVYTDFTSFFQSNPNGVYSYTGGSARGGHAVKVVGWGTTAEGVDYWIIANSWGTSFADGGYFKIRRGTNECTIESRLISAGLPNLNRRTNMIKPIPSYASEFTDEDRAVIDGAFQEIPIDQEVYEVFEHVLSQEQVKSDRVIGIKKAYSQVANGINFKLDIAVKSPSAANKKSSDTNSNGESVVTVVVHKPHGPSAKMQITKFQ